MEYQYDDSVSVISESPLLIPSDSVSSSPASVRLSASDLLMLNYQYIQVGFLFSGKPESSLVPFLKLFFSKLLSVFPPLAGRLSTDPVTGHISVACCNAGALFVHAAAPSIRLADIFDPNDNSGEVPAVYRRFFPFDNLLNFDGHSKPLSAVQITELTDAVFMGIALNHAVMDGTTFSYIAETAMEICKTGAVSNPPSFSRDVGGVLFTNAVIPFPGGRPEKTFFDHKSIRERIFHFSPQALMALKKTARKQNSNSTVSSFQSLCGLVWRCVTRARKLAPNKTTSFVILVNCRDRVNPKMDPCYFGNAIQIVRAEALAVEVAARELGWSADLLYRTVSAHDDRSVREAARVWERDPQGFPVGNPDGTTIMVEGSPRLPTYNINFGMGRPVAIRTGNTNKFDGKCFALPGRDGGGSVDLEVVLKPETMAALVGDAEFMHYVNFGRSAL